MELTKEYLVEQEKKYRALGDRLKADAIANYGAADAIARMLQEMQEKPEVKNG